MTHPFKSDNLFFTSYFIYTEAPGLKLSSQKFYDMTLAGRERTCHSIVAVGATEKQLIPYPIHIHKKIL